VVVLGVILITFIVSHVIPGNPAALWVGAHPTAQQIQRATEELGLNKPISFSSTFTSPIFCEETLEFLLEHTTRFSQMWRRG
jgi:ABC-type dipeptide/oligopeptide/nickel transport system permease component